MAKKKISKLKRPSGWEKIFSSFTSDKGLITRIYRVLKNVKNSFYRNVNDTDQLNK
jgi:hypothetical protein